MTNKVFLFLEAIFVSFLPKEKPFKGPVSATWMQEDVMEKGRRIALQDFQYVLKE